MSLGVPAVVRLFTRAGCSLCVPVKFVCQKAQNRYPFRFEEVNIAGPGNERWLALYTNDIPVVHLNDVEIARHGLKEEVLLRKLEEAGVPTKK